MTNLIDAKIVLEGESVGKVTAVADRDEENQASDQSSLTILVECNAQQSAWVQVDRSNGGELFGGKPYTMFSAVLINPL